MPRRKPVALAVEEDKRRFKLEAELRLLRAKYLKLQKESSAQEQIIAFNRVTIEALPPGSAPPPLPKGNGKRGLESAVLVGSCWHIGETISATEMGNLNAYDFPTFVKRLQWLVDKTVSITQDNMKATEFDELHVLLLGDMVSGIIHEELEASNQLTIVEQANLGAFVTAQAIRDLARTFPHVVVTCVVGNHGRTIQRKYFKHKQTVNWDFVFYTNLGLLLRDQKNVRVVVPQTFWADVEIKGWRFLVMHGDTIKSHMGIPWYGALREAAKWTGIKSAQRQHFQYLVASHFHTKAVVQQPVGELIFNGSLKGGDEYATGLGLFNDPVQLLFGVHKTFGKSWEVSINAKHAGTNAQTPRYVWRRDATLLEQS